MYFKTMFNIPIIHYSTGIIIRIHKGLTLKVLVVKTPSAKTLGMASYCKDGKHVLFFDFDGNTLNEIAYQLQKLQEYYKLSEIYIFENDRPNSFHAVCLDKFRLYDAVEIIRQTTADKAFKYAPLRYAMKKWVLRTESKGKREKPKYLFTLNPYNKQDKRKKSNAHRLYLKLQHGLKINSKGFDDEIELDCFEYYTAQGI